MTSSTSTYKYPNEEVASTFGYPESYKVKPLDVQIALLSVLFPALKPIDVPSATAWLAMGWEHETVATLLLAAGAEDFFAIPRWQNLAGTYNAAVEAVLAKLAETRPFHNYRRGQLGPERLRQSERSSHALDVLAEQQKGSDILVVPAQFGKRHAGRSVRRAREIFQDNEFGLGAFEIACMLLTHPERLTRYEDFWIACAGDEYDADDDGRFDSAPYFGFRAGKLEFGAFWCGRADARCGSASGFLPR